ncbi:putative lipoprotein [Streptomyces scabiei 87.22]|uniref:Putative lipoprotein n=2 Tax=Streptomyces scabiei TaxID=1930 RepID=C9YZ00_STRSW|nr:MULTISPECIES: right-handed parallel beta-helix repeat-containing protein [Streptomyces]MBP5860656.1 right-handed parallel beta-helix repeat-containing protein [Streptomyces sp. LBUM 1484]MBP5879084.1 right-handed parallel beta-helix repeat-containing protein [Streptomyces sp. LBUM 1477]MBP5886776.1 right-handed parallel beta-helix repeat-containing protein [Streptomyces sp. LBUM 1487]MBP5902772.1 right-handed parallel beta-helix repeat-containing protein [Streptomyces sp. LBUM 1488]MDW84765
MGITWRHRAWAVAPVVLALLAATGCDSTPDARPKPPTAPPTAVAGVCAERAAGPSKAPAGAVTVDPAVPGDLAVKTEENPPGTTFWLLPGKHRLGPDRYAQVLPKEGDTYLGAPGAVLDGRKTNQYAFGGSAPDVTIRHLTVQRFVAPHDEGVVNHDSADGWVIEHTTVQNNSGAGLMAGARQRVRGNCLRDNGQYGMNAYKGDGRITGLVVEGNEITGNNTDDWEKRRPGCGCTGGVKFWAVDGADVRGNWVHDNRGAGLWADTNNNDFRIEGNLLEDNDGAALIYETSYNAVVRQNRIRRNNWVEGRDYADRGDSFPFATVYISESGGEPRVRARTDKIEIYRNVLENNWSGITLWENADRFCNSPANTSSGECTLLVKDIKRCKRPAITTAPLYDDCRWRTQRVDVHDNRFVLDKSVLDCAVKCDRMAVLANYGTYPDWSPYRGERVAEAITRKQHNRWHDNVYRGPWRFVVHDPSRVLDFAQWRDTPYRQDAGSRYRAGKGG